MLTYIYVLIMAWYIQYMCPTQMLTEHYLNLKNSLIIHEENTKEMNV
jgi:hypothetical protein